ncbi:MAG: glycerol-3-phosphate dehydrogenase [Hyphomicrobiaceae bacterium]|nr:glycerol-3-phosphate dehydrogenase [Hyphomicrobiaceae bacterium]
MSDAQIYDIAIVGGGINGCGIAADAAGRGLKVALAEKGDLAGATSSASSKLIHGGLRYLEYYEFRLVREALGEREVLLRKAPHLIWPLRFVLPHAEGLRPRWMLRAGLFMYDHLHARSKIPASSSIDLTQDVSRAPLQSKFTKGFSYYDCWVDDARLVVANAMHARVKGADIWTNTEVVATTQQDGIWRVILKDPQVQREIRARSLINAAGPWAERVDRLTSTPGFGNNIATVRLVKGSHLVVPHVHGANDAYILQSADKRVVFVLPFEEHFTIIGTTDVAYDGDPGNVTCTPEEETYLLDLVSTFFKTPLSTKDVVWRYSGVRPLYDDGSANASAVTRDYHLELANAPSSAPRLSIYGGKITTYRCLAEDALARLLPTLPNRAKSAWTANETLPGGDILNADFDSFFKKLQQQKSGFDTVHLRRLARRHGSLIADVLGDARSLSDMGEHIGEGLTEREIQYMRSREWATTPYDILWRRTKLGLHFIATKSDAERRAITDRIGALL